MMQLFHGDCLEELKQIEEGSVDMVLTDPPYSSGGLFAGDRRQSTRDKYTDRDFQGAARLPNFSGDNMDQRSFTEFSRMVFEKCRRKLKPGGGAGHLCGLEKPSGHYGRSSGGWACLEGDRGMG